MLFWYKLIYTKNNVIIILFVRLDVSLSLKTKRTTMKRRYILFLLLFVGFEALSAQVALIRPSSIEFSRSKEHYLIMKPYFEAAYQTYPAVPRGILEAVSFNYTRFTPQIWPDTVEDDLKMPRTYTVMGLTLHGKNYFRENVRRVSNLSGISVQDILEKDETAIMAYAAAVDSLQRKFGCKQGSVEDCFPILVDLSEIPASCEFALNSSMYVIYLFLADSSVMQCGIPRRDIDFDKLFGNMLPILQQHEVNIDATQGVQDVESRDYGAAIWVPAASCNYSSRNGMSVSNVAIHYTEGTYAGAIAWFQNCAAKASAHYVIRSVDGQITQMVRENDKAWHVGVANSYTIGIEHEAYGDVSSFFTMAMYVSSATLVRNICARYPVIKPHHTFYRDTLDDGTALNSGQHPLGGSSSCTQIRGHQHFPNQTHTDPGPYWDWNFYYQLVNPVMELDSSNAETGLFTDSGGSAGGYGNDERRAFLIRVPGADSIVLQFSTFELEPNYDFLWIYAGDSPFAHKLGRWNTQNPGRVVAPGDCMFIEFRSDCQTTAAGWQAQWTACSHQQDIMPPTTQILLDEHQWITQDFVAHFADYDDVRVKYRFYQITEHTSAGWTANAKCGFLCDNFDAPSPASPWTHDGLWQVVDQELVNTSHESRSWITFPFNDQTHDAFLFDFYLAINDTGRVSFCFHVDGSLVNPETDCYGITFDKTAHSLTIWQMKNGMKIFFASRSDIYYATGQPFLCRVVWDIRSRRVMVFRHTALLADVQVDLLPGPGGAVGFELENAIVSIDNLRAYGSRADTVNITVGSHPNAMIASQADNGNSTSKLKSVVMDATGKFSPSGEMSLLVDYTSPPPVSFVRCGYLATVSGSAQFVGNIIAYWNSVQDPHSGVKSYHYLLDLENNRDWLRQSWVNNELQTDCIRSVRLPFGSFFRLVVKVENGAGLCSPKTCSQRYTLTQ